MRLGPFLSSFALLFVSHLAHADPVLNITGTLVDQPADPTTGFQNLGGTFTGDATLNNSQTAFDSVTVTITPVVGSPFSFTGTGITFYQGLGSNMLYEIDLGTILYGSGFDLIFDLPAGSLADFTGAQLCSVQNPCVDGAESTYFIHTPVVTQDDPVVFGSISSLPAAATPEPASFALLGTGLLGIAGIMKRRFAYFLP